MNSSEIVTQVFLIGLGLQFNSMCAHFVLSSCNFPPLKSAFQVAIERTKTKE